jgi:hypothetical protein
MAGIKILRPDHLLNLGLGYPLRPTRMFGLLAMVFVLGLSAFVDAKISEHKRLSVKQMEIFCAFTRY